jgi:hypothetical protein
MYAPRMARFGDPSRVSGIAIALEAILAFFGIYGVGWLMSGYIGTGALIMIAGFIWDLIAGTAIFLTFGLAGVCVGPLHLVFVAATTIALASRRSRPL